MKTPDAVLAALAGMVSTVVPAVAGVTETITVETVMAACAGSAVVRLLHILNGSPESTSSMWARAGATLAMFIIGALFGIFAAAFFDRVTPLGPNLASFFAGFIGYVVIEAAGSREVTAMIRAAVKSALRMGFKKLKKLIGKP